MRVHARAFALVVVSVVVRLATVVAPARAEDDASVVIERAIASSRMLQATGVIERLFATLRESLCVNAEEKCARYDEATREAWSTFARNEICGVGIDEEEMLSDISQTNTQGAFAVMLSKCASPWFGDLERGALTLSATALARASATRADVAAVIAANDIKAHRSPMQTGDDLELRNPAFIPALAPVATELSSASFGSTRPVVVTAERAPDEGTYESAYAYDVFIAIDNARLRGSFSVAGDTEAFPDDFAARVENEAASIDEYRKRYLTHPFAKAHYDKASKCVGRDLTDALCFVRVIPEVGYTHAEDRTRLLTFYAETLNASFVDYNQPRSYVPNQQRLA